MPLCESTATVLWEIGRNYRPLADHSCPSGSPSHLLYDLGMVDSGPIIVQGSKRTELAVPASVPGCSSEMQDL